MTARKKWWVISGLVVVVAVASLVVVKFVIPPEYSLHIIRYKTAAFQIQQGYVLPTDPKVIAKEWDDRDAAESKSFYLATLTLPVAPPPMGGIAGGPCSRVRLEPYWDVVTFYHQGMKILQATYGPSPCAGIVLDNDVNVRSWTLSYYQGIFAKVVERRLYGFFIKENG